MNMNWTSITEENVIEAIRIFNTNNEDFPPAKNTFIDYEGKKYPAKHIRSMAYKVAFGLEVPKSEFSGGLETVRFFEKLGFEINYLPRGRKIAKQNNPSKDEITAITKSSKIKEPLIEKISGINVIEQKNSLQLVLNRYFEGDIVSEKTFGWLITPSDTGDYSYLINALKDYRGMSGFNKPNYKLRCDFVCESRKLIFEYDERQHFSHARKVALESYPEDISLFFDKQKWVSTCERVNAKDNHPANRDESRAYYDSIRDILCAKNGYRLIRIMHGEYDWDDHNASKYIEKMIVQEYRSKVSRFSRLQNLKIGLYIQGDNDSTRLKFSQRLKDASEQRLDIFVFPETCYTPYYNKFYKIRIGNPDDVIEMVQRAMKISKKVGCAVIIGAEDTDGLIYNVYANASATGDETTYQLYRKHTAASNSPLEFTDYGNEINNIFKPIVLKGVKIGMTICYDCNHSAFSRAWGKNDVDIIINSTGGNVVYTKWYRYNKTRSLENQCFSFCTMGYNTGTRNNSYTFGFTPNGVLMTGKPIYPIESDAERMNNVFVYNTSDFDGRFEPDISLGQQETINKYEDWSISPESDDIDLILTNSKKITEGLYRIKVKDCNLIICCVDGEKILKVEENLRLLYNSDLNRIMNKRYLIINRWDSQDNDYFDTVLSDVLKVRTAENFCAVLYSSPQKTMCFQAGKNKNVQSVKLVDGMYNIDFSRMTGPEAIWKNKGGMRASWRRGYETLINYIDE